MNFFSNGVNKCFGNKALLSIGQFVFCQQLQVLMVDKTGSFIILELCFRMKPFMLDIRL